MSAAICFDRLFKKFPGVEAVADLSLVIPEGAVFALIGPNGAGKTTAIKTLLNIIRPDSGYAEVLDTDSRCLGPNELARIGYVSENQQLPGWMTVRYFFSYCKHFYPTWRDQDLAEMIQSYGLPLERRLKALSHGMRIKTALASSLAYRPKLIVLDEPFSGLDVLVREELIESILERAEEATVFIASHDLSEIESLASHIGYIDRGRLQFVEEMATLSERFREIEVTLQTPPPASPEFPATWLNPETSPTVIRFVDSRFEKDRTEAEIFRRIPVVDQISVRSLSLRSIFIALAKAARKG